MQRLYGKVSYSANKPPPYIPIFLTLFKLYGGINTNSRKTKSKNNKKKMFYLEHTVIAIFKVSTFLVARNIS
jgi:hypothetical protein